MILKDWSVTNSKFGFFLEDEESYHLQGRVYGHPKFEDGTYVRTSKIVSILSAGDYKEVVTRSGSLYELYKDNINPDCKTGYTNWIKELFD